MHRFLNAKLVDYSAAGTLVASPVWAMALDNINRGLTALSLLVGLAFALWRFREAWRKRKGGKDD